MKRHPRPSRILPGLIALSAVIPLTATGSSFQILEQSPSRLGTAFSGTASSAGDPTTVFFNPAAMAKLDGAAFTAAGNLILVDSAFNDSGSTAGTGTGFERPLAGEENSTDEPGLVPNLYYVRPLNERWTFGLGVNGPFGLASSYDDDWQGRYHATDSELSVININPTFAYAVDDRLSLGIGVSYQYADTTLESEVDSFNSCREAGNSPGGCAAAHGGPGNRDADSSSKIEGDDDTFVLDLSVHWQVTDRTAIGATFRQGGDFTLEGDAKFDKSSSCLGDPFCNGALDTLQGDVKADADLPDTLTVSASHALDDRWTIHGDIAWTEWSSIQEIEIENTDNGQTINTLELEYDDTVRVALGATYRHNDRWTWRGGIAFDEAPQTDEELVTPRIPDQDRTWLALGFNYRFSGDKSLDVGYAHLFVDDASIDSTAQGNTLRGDFDATVDIFGVQGNWRF